MSEPAKPKRQFWRIHLSTAVSLMLLAGFNLLLCSHGTLLSRGPHGDEYRYGWPFEFTILRWDEMNPNGPMKWELSSYSAIFANVACCIFALGMVAVVCEYLIRRREGRKT